jgi:hypothetical protein
MKKILFTYNDFVEFHNHWRQNLGRKPRHKVLLAIYYPFALLIFTFTIGMIVLVLTSLIGSARKTSHRSKYKKVIKEGLFWDTTYYIEK